MWYLGIIILLLDNYAHACHNNQSHKIIILLNYQESVMIRKKKKKTLVEVAKSPDKSGSVASNRTRLTSLGCGLITRQQNNTSTDSFFGQSLCAHLSIFFYYH